MTPARLRGLSLVSSLDLALISVQAIDRELVTPTDCQPVRVRALARDLDRALTRALTREPDSELGSELAAARQLCSALSFLDLDLGREASNASDLTGGIVRVLRRARDQVAVHGRVQSVPRDSRSGEGMRARWPASSACRLVAVGARLLPARDQARYGEEWHSELHDLAAAGAGRRQQLSYAVRLLTRAVPLRLAVLAPRRGKASP